jgi:hypothetical protein
MLPIGRVFGRITKKVPTKKWSGRIKCGLVLSDFEQKGPNRGQTLENFVSILLSSLILGKIKKYYSFSINTDKNSVFLKPKCPQKYWGGRICFSSAAEFFRRTVKSSNFVILLSENIFFCQTFFRLPHNIF